MTCGKSGRRFRRTLKNHGRQGDRQRQWHGRRDSAPRPRGISGVSPGTVSTASAGPTASSGPFHARRAPRPADPGRGIGSASTGEQSADRAWRRYARPRAGSPLALIHAMSGRSGPRVWRIDAVPNNGADPPERSAAAISRRPSIPARAAGQLQPNGAGSPACHGVNTYKYRWGERRGSNPRQPVPQTGALPTELRPPPGLRYCGRHAERRRQPHANRVSAAVKCRPTAGRPPRPAPHPPCRRRNGHSARRRRRPGRVIEGAERNGGHPRVPR